MTKHFVRSATLALAGASLVNAAAQAQTPHDLLRFDMRRSAAVAAAGCMPNAIAKVTVKTVGEFEIMSVRATDLPPNTGFDLFIIQVPNAPFGLAWYQGDMQSDSVGRAEGTFIGRFNEETFIVAPGAATAPKVHGADATANPATAPVHTFHVGLWFNSPTEAQAAGCPGAVTPFNGEHNAGVQALSTNQFGALNGPLRLLKP
jgi:hypothetical protein